MPKIKINKKNIKLKSDFGVFKIYPPIENLTVIPTSTEQTFTHPNSYGYDIVTIEPVEAKTLNITPTTSSQEYIDLYGRVTVDAVDSSIDENILSNNIKSGVEILGVTGEVDELIPEEITIIPMTSQQIIVPSENKSGITHIEVSAVDSSIDSDIQAGNIKSGVNILGIDGTVDELIGEEITITPTTSEQIITPSTGKTGITKVTVNPFVNDIEWNGNSSNFSNITITPTFRKFTYKEGHPSRMYLAFNYAKIADDIFCKFKNKPETYTVSVVSQSFRQTTAKRIGFDVSLASVGNMVLMFYGCSNLEEVYGEPFDTSGIVNSNSMPDFSLCANFKKITFKENTIKFNIAFKTSPLLENDTIISIANGLNESVTSQTLTLHATPKAKCSTIMGTVDSTTYNYKVFVPSESGTISLEEFITIEKGWSLA